MTPRSQQILFVRLVNVRGCEKALVLQEFKGFLQQLIQRTPQQREGLWKVNEFAVNPNRLVKLFDVFVSAPAHLHVPDAEGAADFAEFLLV